MTSQGTAHGRFTRCIELRNLRGAEMAARELGRLSLEDALQLCLLYASGDRARFERAAVRSLERLIAERSPSLEDVGLAVGALRRRAPRQRATTTSWVCSRASDRLSRRNQFGGPPECAQMGPRAGARAGARAARASERAVRTSRACSCRSSGIGVSADPTLRAPPCHALDSFRAHGADDGEEVDLLLTR